MGPLPGQLQSDPSGAARPAAGGERGPERCGSLAAPPPPPPPAAAAQKPDGTGPGRQELYFVVNRLMADGPLQVSHPQRDRAGGAGRVCRPSGTGRRASRLVPGPADVGAGP